MESGSLAEPSSNLKGIMLSERPPNSQPNGEGAGVIPFRPANVTRDPLGVHRQPMRLANIDKKAKPREALVRHRTFLKELQQSIRSTETNSEDSRAATDVEQERLRELSVAFHRTVLSGAEKEKLSTAWLELTNAAGLSVPPMSSLAVAERSMRQQEAKESTSQEQYESGNASRAKDSLEASILAPEAPPVPGCKTVRYEETQIPADKIDALDKEMEEFVRRALSKAPPPTGLISNSVPEDPEKSKKENSSNVPPVAKENSASNLAGKPPKGKKSEKPAWALSENQVREMEEKEEEELLSFAEGLDFDQYLSEEDVELKEALEVLRQERESGGKEEDAKWKQAFVRALNHVALRSVQTQKRVRMGDRDESGSVAGHTNRTLGAESTISQGTMTSEVRAKVNAEKRAAIEAAQAAKLSEPQWDASTKAGDASVGKFEGIDKKNDVDEFLRMNPELKAVHSATSARILLSREGGSAPAQKA